MNKNDYLQQVKDACSSGGYKLETAFHNLIKNTDRVSKILKMIVELGFKYLVLFEQDHPDVKYPRVLLEQIQNQIDIDFTKFGNRDKYAQSYPDVCSYLFDSGLDYLEDAYNAMRANDASKAKGLLSYALNGFLAAFVFRFWQNDNPETYEIWLRSAEGVIYEEIYSRVKSYRNSPTFTQYRQSLCEELIEMFSKDDA